MKKRLQQSNDKYKKKKEDLNKRAKFLKEGELVMAQMRKEIFSRGTYSKMKYKKVGPCRN